MNPNQCGHFPHIILSPTKIILKLKKRLPLPIYYYFFIIIIRIYYYYAIDFFFFLLSNHVFKNEEDRNEHSCFWGFLQQLLPLSYSSLVFFQYFSECKLFIIRTWDFIKIPSGKCSSHLQRVLLVAYENIYLSSPWYIFLETTWCSLRKLQVDSREQNEASANPLRYCWHKNKKVLESTAHWTLDSTVIIYNH